LGEQVLGNSINYAGIPIFQACKCFTAKWIGFVKKGKIFPIILIPAVVAGIISWFAFRKIPSGKNMIPRTRPSG